MAVETVGPAKRDDSAERAGETKVSRNGSFKLEKIGLGPLIIPSLHRPWWKSFSGEVGQLFEKQQPLPPLPRYRDAAPGEYSLGPMNIESLHRPWWKSFGEQLGQLFEKPQQLPPLPQYREAAPGEQSLGPMVIESLQRPWWLTLKQSIEDLLRERKLPPPQVSSKPVPVRSIWGSYNNRQRAGLISAGVHVFVVVLMFTVFRGPDFDMRTGSVTLILPVDISPYLTQLRNQGRAADSGGGGGGGAQSPLPASRGRLPRFEMEQLTPPTPVIRNENPQLAVEPTVVVPPDQNMPQIDLAVFGDPLGNVGPPSAGPGTGGGIGTGSGGGVGSGSGAGVGPGRGGGIGDGVFRVGGGVSPPRLTRKVEPEYSEEARKAKYQGTVVLQVEVWPDGKAHNIRVIRSPGLGLEDKAIDAVRQWEFVPGKKDGAPVKVAATIEVNFRLL